MAMKKIRVVTETPHGSITDYFEVDDGTPEDAIAEEAQVIFENHCSYGWSVVEDGEDE